MGKYCREVRYTPFELREYHNAHCELEALLGPVFPKNQEVILIPEQEKHTDIFSENKGKEIRAELINNSLSLNPDFGNKVIYEVSYTLQKAGTINQVYYLIKILPEKTSKGMLFTLTRDTVYINGEKADLQAENLALDTTYQLYPIQIKTNNQGQFIEVINQKELLEKWKQSKEESYPLFTGETVQKYQELVQETLEKERRIYLHLFTRSFYFRLL